MLKMFDELGTPNNKKQKMAFPDAGDHVIGSYLTTSNYSQVEKVALSFLEEKLNIDLN